MKRGNTTMRVIGWVTAVTFAVSYFAFDLLRSKETQASVLGLPEPTQAVRISADKSVPVLKGLKVDPQHPLDFKFIMDSGDQEKVAPEEARKLISYFLAGLTIPGDQLWVNLSPYEKDRVMDDKLSYTDLGKDMLGQDYILKQLSASMTNPQSSTGKEFWGTALDRISQELGTTALPVNTFNKIWIVPESSEVHESGTMVFITKASLKAMFEEDYLALSKNDAAVKKETGAESPEIAKVNKISSQLIRELVVPAVTQEANYGANFGSLRQMYYSLVLATWFRKKFEDSFFKIYIDAGKVDGIDLTDKQLKQKVFALYAQAFKKGVYDFVKKEKDPATKKTVNRRYFSGGLALTTENTTPKVVPGLAASAIETSLQTASSTLIEVDAAFGTNWEHWSPRQTVEDLRTTDAREIVADIADDLFRKEGVEGRRVVTRPVLKILAGIAVERLTTPDLKVNTEDVVATVKKVVDSTRRLSRGEWLKMDRTAMGDLVRRAMQKQESAARNNVDVASVIRHDTPMARPAAEVASVNILSGGVSAQVLADRQGSVNEVIMPSVRLMENPFAPKGGYAEVAFAIDHVLLGYSGADTQMAAPVTSAAVPGLELLDNIASLGGAYVPGPAGDGAVTLMDDIFTSYSRGETLKQKGTAVTENDLAAQGEFGVESVIVDHALAPTMDIGIQLVLSLQGIDPKKATPEQIAAAAKETALLETARKEVAGQKMADEVKAAAISKGILPANAGETVLNNFPMAFGDAIAKSGKSTTDLAPIVDVMKEGIAMFNAASKIRAEAENNPTKVADVIRQIAQESGNAFALEALGFVKRLSSNSYVAGDSYLAGEIAQSYAQKATASSSVGLTSDQIAWKSIQDPAVVSIVNVHLANLRSSNINEAEAKRQKLEMASELSAQASNSVSYDNLHVAQRIRSGVLEILNAGVPASVEELYDKLAQIRGDVLAQKGQPMAESIDEAGFEGVIANIAVPLGFMKSDDPQNMVFGSMPRAVVDRLSRDAEVYGAVGELLTAIVTRGDIAASQAKLVGLLSGENANDLTRKLAFDDVAAFSTAARDARDTRSAAVRPIFEKAYREQVEQGRAAAAEKTAADAGFSEADVTKQRIEAEKRIVYAESYKKQIRDGKLQRAEEIASEAGFTKAETNRMKADIERAATRNVIYSLKNLSDFGYQYMIAYQSYVKEKDPAKMQLANDIAEKAMFTPKEIAKLQEKANDKLGGIDFNNIFVGMDKSSTKIVFAPVDLGDFKGFAVKIVSIRGISAEGVAKLAQA